MKKNLIYSTISVLLIVFCHNPMSAQDKKDKYNAINDYLETNTKGETKEIIIIQEKLNPNETIYIFKDYDNDKRIRKTDVKAGDITVDTLLYNEKDWGKMNKEYSDGSPFITETYLPKENNWKSSDFRLKKIIYENKDRYSESVLNGKFDDIFKGKVIYTFSEPIYYKNKKYIAFTVSIGGWTGSYSTFVVVMKKLKGKWVQKYYISPPWHS